MRMTDTLEQLEIELEHGGFEILPDKYQERLYKKIIMKSKTKSEMIQQLKENQFGTEMIMFLTGMVIGLEQKTKTAKSLLPSFMRKD